MPSVAKLQLCDMEQEYKTFPKMHVKLVQAFSHKDDGLPVSMSVSGPSKI
jgi:hypothetical protein